MPRTERFVAPSFAFDLDPVSLEEGDKRDLGFEIVDFRA